MGFWWYCASSLDLTNFVVQSHGEAAAETSRRIRWQSLPESLEFGNLEVQESGNLGVWNLTNLKKKTWKL